MYTVTKLELDYWLNPTTLTNDSFTSKLIDIAGQCPDYGGKAVYWARALVNKEYPYLSWDDESICQDTLGSLMLRPKETKNVFGSSNEQNDFLTSPNPSNGLVNITCPNNFEGIILVKDILGREVYKSHYHKNMTCDLSNYSGVLILNFIDNTGQLINSKRQVILK